MAKTTKAQRGAERAVEAAASAAKTARKTAKQLPGSVRRDLAPLIEDAAAAAEVSGKRLRAKPRKTARRADEAAERLERAVQKALAKAQRKEQARRDAKAAAAEAARASAVGESSPLSALTVRALRAQAREAGHTGFWRLNKAQLVELLS